MSSLLGSEIEDEKNEQVLATLSDQTDALSLVNIVEKEVAEQTSLSAKQRETQIFKTWRRKENTEAGGS